MYLSLIIPLNLRPFPSLLVTSQHPSFNGVSVVGLGPPAAAIGTLSAPPRRKPTGFGLPSGDRIPAPLPELPQPSSPDPPQTFAGIGFAGGVLAGLVLFAVLLCTINIIFKAVVPPKLPVFTVTLLSVSDFNTSGSALTANWETSVAVDNPNSKLRVRFDDIQCYVYYRDPRDYLAWTTVEPTSVGMKGRGVIDARMAMAGAAGQPERTVVEDIGRERRSRTVGFALDLEMKGTFRYGSWWTRHVRLPVSCVDLAVSFVGSEPRGALAGDEPRACHIL